VASHPLRGESLDSMRRRAIAYIERADRPVAVNELADVLFPDPGRASGVAPLLIRTLLSSDERFRQRHRGRWELASRAYQRMPLASASFAVVDLETTGSLPATDRIIEIAVVRLEGMRPAGEFQSLITSGTTVPPLIQQLTGIEDSMLAGAPALPAVAPRLLELLDDALFVAHNAEFDYAFLRSRLRACDVHPAPTPRVCTLRLVQRHLPFLRSCALDAVAAHYGVPLLRRHRAVDDARATAGVLVRLLHELRAAGIETVGGLLEFQAGRR
jgi:DNA polymerase-3 subunit epsilon